jgi:hypothetical protein
MRAQIADERKAKARKANGNGEMTPQSALQAANAAWRKAERTAASLIADIESATERIYALVHAEERAEAAVAKLEGSIAQEAEKAVRAGGNLSGINIAVEKARNKRKTLADELAMLRLGRDGMEAKLPQVKENVRLAKQAAEHAASSMLLDQRGKGLFERMQRRAEEETNDRLLVRALAGVMEKEERERFRGLFHVEQPPMPDEPQPSDWSRHPRTLQIAQAQQQLMADHTAKIGL